MSLGLRLIVCLGLGGMPVARASYRDALLPEAETLRKDVTAAWYRGELATDLMVAAEWERLSVKLASLEALVAYEAALARVLAIIDRP